MTLREKKSLEVQISVGIVKYMMKHRAMIELPTELSKGILSLFRKEVEGIKLPKDKEEDAIDIGYTLGFNRAIQAVLALLKEEK